MQMIAIREKDVFCFRLYGCDKGQGRKQGVQPINFRRAPGKKGAPKGLKGGPKRFAVFVKREKKGKGRGKERQI